MDQKGLERWRGRLSLAGGALCVSGALWSLLDAADAGGLAGAILSGGVVLAMATLAGLAGARGRLGWMAGAWVVLAMFGGGLHGDAGWTGGRVLHQLGLWTLLGAGGLLLLERLARRSAAQSTAAEKGADWAPVSDQEGPMDGELVGRWRMTGMGGPGVTPAPAKFLGARWTFSPDGRLKVTMWGMGRGARYTREGRHLRVKLRGQWPAHDYTILSLGGDEMVLRNDYRGGLITRLNRDRQGD